MSQSQYHPELLKAIEHLIENVLNYQSEVWDSQENGVDRTEAEKAAAVLIYTHLFDENNIPHVDGADMGWAVDSALMDESEKQRIIEQNAEIKAMHDALIDDE